MVNERPDLTTRPIPDEELISVGRLVRAQRWASLATIDDDGFPLGSMVAYVPQPDFSGFLVHVSKLARHTRNLLTRNYGALTIGEPDDGEGDPQVLARICIQARVEVLERETADYAAARELYLERLPDAAPLFGFTDFVMFNFVAERAHYVGGFARAYGFDAEKLLRAGQL